MKCTNHVQKSKLIITISFLLGLSAHSLAQSVQISGQVINNSDVEGIHVLNKTAGISTITDQKGNFQIDVKINDTIWFASLQYMLKEVVVTARIIQDRQLMVQLLDAVNQLAEVRIGNLLSGDLRKDIGNVSVKEPLNFDDVGIPGFLGTPEEKIAPIVPGIGSFTRVDVEALYKHLSGYYKKLRLRRKWDGQNVTVLQILGIYGENYFKEAYNIPQERLYDFLLFCIEVTQLQRDINDKNFVNVLTIFEEKSTVYKSRLEAKED